MPGGQKSLCKSFVSHQTELKTYQFFFDPSISEKVRFFSKIFKILKKSRKKSQIFSIENHMKKQKNQNFRNFDFLIFHWFSIEKIWDFFEIFSKIFKIFGGNLTFSLIIGSSICKKINHVEWWDLTKTQVYFCHPGNCSTDYTEMCVISTIFLTDRSNHKKYRLQFREATHVLATFRNILWM